MSKPKKQQARDPRPHCRPEPHRHRHKRPGPYGRSSGDADEAGRTRYVKMTGAAEAVPVIFTYFSQKVPTLVKNYRAGGGILWADQGTDLSSSRDGKSGPTVRQTAQKTGHIWQHPTARGTRPTAVLRAAAPVRQTKNPRLRTVYIVNRTLSFLAGPPVFAGGPASCGGDQLRSRSG